MLRFANPEFLYLLILIPLLVALFVLYRSRQRRFIRRFGEMELLRPLMRGLSPRRKALKFSLLLLALSLLIIALARPQTGSKLKEEKRSGGQIMFVVDVSRSMLAEDFTPSRLERTKYAISRLLEKLTDKQVGVVVFAGDAYVQLPITSDFRTASSFVSALSTDMVSRQGTSVQRAMELAITAMPGKLTAEGTPNKESRAMVLITDGESHDDNPMAAAYQAAEAGIKVHTIGIGTPQGAPISINGEMIKDENGEIVMSKLDEQTLSAIAATTGGAYVRSTEGSVGLNEIFDYIQKMEKEDATVLVFDEYAEQFFYLLYIVLALLVLEFFLPENKRREAR